MRAWRWSDEWVLGRVMYAFTSSNSRSKPCERVPNMRPSPTTPCAHQASQQCSQRRLTPPGPSGVTHLAAIGGLQPGVGASQRLRALRVRHSSPCLGACLGRPRGIPRWPCPGPLVQHQAQQGRQFAHQGSKPGAQGRGQRVTPFEPGARRRCGPRRLCPAPDAVTLHVQHRACQAGKRCASPCLLGARAADAAPAGALLGFGLALGRGEGSSRRRGEREQQPGGGAPRAVAAHEGARLPPSCSPPAVPQPLQSLC